MRINVLPLNFTPSPSGWVMHKGEESVSHIIEGGKSESNRALAGSMFENNRFAALSCGKSGENYALTWWKAAQKKRTKSGKFLSIKP